MICAFQVPEDSYYSGPQAESLLINCRYFAMDCGTNASCEFFYDTRPLAPQRYFFIRVADEVINADFFQTSCQQFAENLDFQILSAEAADKILFLARIDSFR